MSNKDCGDEYVEMLESIREDVRELRFAVGDKDHAWKQADGLLDKLSSLEILMMRLLQQSDPL